MKKFLPFLLLFLLHSSRVFAAVHSEVIEYQHGDVTLEGYLAYNEKYMLEKAKHPAVIVVHEWKGLGDYAKRRADQLAELGYVAFAIDMYGKGVRPESHEEAAKISGMYRKDTNLMRARAHAAIERLKEVPIVDAGRIAAIGYCFGGAAVLEMARSGEDLKGVVSFHGALSTPTPAEPGIVTAKVLVLHGGSDTFITPADVAAFKDEMKNAGVNYRFIAYEGAVHSFTVKEAGDDPTKGMAYNEKADHASWDEMKKFLSENLGV